MKVLQLGKYYPPAVGGTEKVIKVLTETLNEFGIKTDVLCSNEKPKDEISDFKNYKVIKTSQWFKLASTSVSPSMIFKLREIQNHYDIIHVHMPDPMATLALFINRPKAKLVLQWHMDIVRQKILLHFYKPLVKWLFKKAHLCLVSSEKLLKESVFSPLMERKTKVLPLPFDENELKNSPPNPDFEYYLLSLAKTRKIVLYVGRLVYYKGVEVLISAVSFLPEHIAVFIVGNGPLKDFLKKKIKKLKLEGRVFLLGQLSNSELASCYRICNLFCLPSLYKTEAFGLVQLEAMSFGKPVVSTKLPASGVCEVNIDGETGLCVEPGNPQQLAKAILEILEDEILYLRMSQNAKRRVKLFHKKNIVSKLINFYKDLIYNF